jgi:UDP-glucose 4-epimerase
MKKLLIIGSKGFIGQAAFAYFQRKEEWKVFGADVVVDYPAERYFLIDTTSSDFSTVFKAEDFDFCINCSGAASVPNSLRNPLRDYMLNTVNVFKMLSAIREFQPTCKFINLSSAAVYGNPVKLPIKETDDLLPLSPYGHHKMQAEMVCREFYELFDIASVNLRIFSAYGEGLKKQLFWDLHQKTKQSGTDISLFGTGAESRDFIYIQDLLQVFEVVMNNGAFKGDTINVANGIEVTIKEVAETFFSCYDTAYKPIFSKAVREGDPNNWVADISKLKDLGYNRQYTLKAGFKHFHKWVTTVERT